MKPVRRIDLENVTIGYWAAIDQLMAEELHEGTFQETSVVIHWSDARPSVGIAVYEDGDHLDQAAAEEIGYASGRYLGFGGGSGLFNPALPLPLTWYRKPYSKPDVTLRKETDLVGQSTTNALRKLGLDAIYRSICDTEIVVDGERYKIAASAAVNPFSDNLWATCSSLIYGPLNPALFGNFSKVIRIPPEKFEDKKVKTVAGRMRPIADIVPLVGLSLSKGQVVDAVVRENLCDLMGGEPVPGKFSSAELSYIGRVVPFFESKTWAQRVSTRRLCFGVPDNWQVGTAVYKSRKLVKASLVVDEGGTIRRALFTGDFYFRPQPTLFAQGAVADLAQAICGARVDDEAGIRERVDRVFERPDVEAAAMVPEHFAIPAVLACGRLQPVGQLLRG